MLDPLLAHLNPDTTLVRFDVPGAGGSRISRFRAAFPAGRSCEDLVSHGVAEKGRGRRLSSALPPSASSSSLTSTNVSVLTSPQLHKQKVLQPRALRRHTSRSSTVTSRNAPTHIRRKRSTRVTTPNDRKHSSSAISQGSVRGSSPLSSTLSSTALFPGVPTATQEVGLRAECGTPKAGRRRSRPRPWTMHPSHPPPYYW